MTSFPQRVILNLAVANITMEEFLATVRRGVVYTPNIDHFVLLQSDRTFYDAYHAADVVVMDSQVIVLLTRIFRPAFREKVAGSDLFLRFCEYHRSDPSVRVFVLGGMDDVAETVRATINRRCGREVIVGAYSPPYGFEADEHEQAKAIAMVRASGANVLAVGLGTPKQEVWIYHHRRSLPEIDLFVGVGATLDFIVGKQKRAPQWMQDWGLEWFYRLLRDPGKFARRYLVRDMKFFLYFIKDRLGWYRDPFSDRSRTSAPE